MPTLRDRTRTSSAAIDGTSSSCTDALRGSSNTSAFIGLSSSLIDQALDLVGGAGREPLECTRRLVERDGAGDDAFDRQASGGGLRGGAGGGGSPTATTSPH